MQRFFQIAEASLRGFQPREVTKDLFLAAGDERSPCGERFRVFAQSGAEPGRHRMHRSAAIGVVETDLHLHPIAHGCLGGLADVPVQVEVKAAVAHRHHVDAPGGFGFSVDADENGKRFSPATFERDRTGFAHVNVRISAVDFDDGLKTQLGHSGGGFG